MKNKVVKYLLLVVLLANIGSLIYLWTNNPFDKRRRPKDVVKEELKLNEEQQKQFELLKTEHRKQTDSLNKQMADLRNQLYLLRDDSQKNLVDSLSSEISNRQKMIEYQTYEHFMKVRAICNPEQQAKFDTLIKRFIRFKFSKERHKKD